jgi:uncharacterized membrane protein YagU involved in acid resistance
MKALFVRRASPWKGLAAGAVAGLVASAAMNLFQLGWNAVASRRESDASSGGGEEDVTVKAASAVSEGVFHHRLTRPEKRVGGNVVHYAFGGSVGALYGLVAERHPDVTTGAGLPFGVVFWLVADEMAVPALGLSRPATSYPVGVHAYALASHLVFGACAEGIRHFVRAKL